MDKIVSSKNYTSKPCACKLRSQETINSYTYIGVGPNGFPVGSAVGSRASS
jgi:hypothetical protein